MENSQAQVQGNNRPSLRLLLFPLLAVLLGHCVSVSRESPYQALMQPVQAVAEDKLLDVGIVFFDPNLESLNSDEQKSGIPQVRLAESRLLPMVLRHTLVNTEQWGNVFVLGDRQQNFDVTVQGKILESNSQQLRLLINARDSRGVVWFSNAYTQYIAGEVYEEGALGVNDPFQSLYNQIANDLLTFRQTRLADNDVAVIRNLTALQFASRFNVERVNAYFSTDNKGNSQLLRTPAAQDPLFVQINAIRERDGMFHSLMQEKYYNFVREIGNSYFLWHRDEFRQLRQTSRQQTSAGLRILGGTLLLGVAVATADTSSIWSTTASTVGALGGVALIGSGIGGLSSAEPFLQELSRSFGNDVSTEVLELEERRILLTGTVEDLYLQWSEILQALVEEQL